MYQHMPTVEMAQNQINILDNESINIIPINIKPAKVIIANAINT